MANIERFPQDSRVDTYPFLHLVVGGKHVWPHISVIQNEIEEFALIAWKRKKNGICIDRSGSFRFSSISSQQMLVFIYVYQGFFRQIVEIQTALTPPDSARRTTSARN